MKNNTLIVAGLAGGLVFAGTASAQIVGDIVGILPGDTQTSTLSVNAGDAFTGGVLISTTVSNLEFDTIGFFLTGLDGLEFGPDWFTWSAPFVTGGIDDVSNPAAEASGIFSSDAFFSNLTPNSGDVFSEGILVTFTLTIPETFLVGTSFDIGFVGDEASDGFSLFDFETGSPLTVTVVPAPATAVLAGLGGLAMTRRRR